MTTDSDRSKKPGGVNTDSGTSKKGAQIFSRRHLVLAVLFTAILLPILWFGFARATGESEIVGLIDRSLTKNRPLESRITGLQYAPFHDTQRAGDPETADGEGIDSAKKAILTLLVDHPDDPHVAHEAGRLFLVKRDFKRAIHELERAKTLKPDSPEVINDLGTAYLEEYKSLDSEQKDVTRSLKAFECFEEAIALDNKLLPALFNRAQFLQSKGLPGQAREAWQKYIAYDPDSRWTREAEENLRRIPDYSGPNDTNKVSSESAFITEMTANNKDAAFEIASLNRELISTSYLPQKFAMLMVETEDPGLRAERLKALEFLGQIEKERIGDNFASDLSSVYSTTTPENLSILKNAQALIKIGYSKSRSGHFSEALERFIAARKEFVKAGSMLEAETIVDYFIAYCYYSLEDRAKALIILEQIDKYCTAKGYTWFGLMNSYWLIGGRESIAVRTITEAKIEYEELLEKARLMGDVYMTQKFIVSLILKYDFLRQDKNTYHYIDELLKLSQRPGLSDFQKYRNFDQIIQVLTKSGHPAFTRAVNTESIALSKATSEDPGFAMTADLNGGAAFLNIGDIDQAEKFLKSAFEKVLNLPSDKGKDRDQLRLFINLGHLERKRENFKKALEYYDMGLDLIKNSSIAEQDRTKTGFDNYELRKAKLKIHYLAGDDLALENELAAAIKLAEAYRGEIMKEQDRLSFFDDQQAVYDIGIDLEVKRGRIENAFDLAETSNSRSLSDWLAKGARVHAEKASPEIFLNDSTVPLNLTDVRLAMPENTQLVQYRILEDKLLIWVVTKENLQWASVPIPAIELKEKITRYVDLIHGAKTADLAETTQLARELYDILITPVSAYIDAGKQLCVIPNKELFYVPFAALRSPSDRYVVEDFTVMYASSANVFVHSTRNAAARSGITGSEHALVVGDPFFEPDAFPGLKRLPDAVDEARFVAKQYPKNTLLVRENATRESFLAAGKNADLIHFAGHYVAEPDSPLRSRLILAKASNAKDIGLTNLELLASRNSKARLVILSACQTGVEGYYGGEGLMGLSRTFLALGTPLVIASAWKVETEATSRLMQDFHRHRVGQKMSSVAALRATQLDMMRDTANGYNSPYYWAAFSAFGGYAAY